MLPPLGRIRLDEILSHIGQSKYFVLHAPRQTGKTTCLLALIEYLNRQGAYRAVYCNVESAQAAREDVDRATSAILNELGLRVRTTLGDAAFEEECDGIIRSKGPDSRLNAALTRLAEKDSRPVVVCMDEIDSLVGDTLVSALRQIRSGYDRRPAGFPQAIILCGVRDVRDYRMYQSGKEVVTGGSAFNIKAESLRIGDFSFEEVRELLSQHTSATGQTFDKEAIEKIFALAGGQPWLVNALAYEICFRSKDGRDRSASIAAAMVDSAKEALILRRDTHLDQLIDKLREPRVRRVIEPMLAGVDVKSTIPTDDRQYVQDLGLIRETPDGIRIANPIYQEIVPRELAMIMQENVRARVQSQWYVDPATGRLLMEKLLGAFQQFFRENSQAWLERFEYKEAGPQLLLQAFLQRIVNGNGSIAREYGLGRQRVDLCVSWPSPGADVQKEVLELKIVRKSLQATIAQGCSQLAEYMDTCGVQTGHLILFDRSAKKPWSRKIFRRQKTDAEGKTVVVWGM